MRVKLVFHGILIMYNNDRPEMEQDVPEGTTVGQLLAKIGLPAEEVAFAAVNNSRAPLSWKLREGDEVKLFQYVGGG